MIALTIVAAVSCVAEEKGYISWPTTPSLGTAEVVCPVGMSGKATRVCTASGTWGEVNNGCSRTIIVGGDHAITNLTQTLFDYHYHVLPNHSF